MWFQDGVSIQTKPRHANFYMPSTCLLVLGVFAFACTRYVILSTFANHFDLDCIIPHNLVRNKKFHHATGFQPSVKRKTCLTVGLSVTQAGVSNSIISKSKTRLFLFLSARILRTATLIKSPSGLLRTQGKQTDNQTQITTKS